MPVETFIPSPIGVGISVLRAINPFEGDSARKTRQQAVRDQTIRAIRSFEADVGTSLRDFRIARGTAIASGTFRQFNPSASRSQQFEGGGLVGGRASPRMSRSEVARARARAKDIPQKTITELNSAQILSRVNLPAIPGSQNVRIAGVRTGEGLVKAVTGPILGTGALIGAITGVALFPDPRQPGQPPQPPFAGQGPPVPGPRPLQGPPSPGPGQPSPVAPSAAPVDRQEAFKKSQAKAQELKEISVTARRLPQPAPAPGRVSTPASRLITRAVQLATVGFGVLVAGAGQRTRSQQLGIAQTGQPTPTPTTSLQPQAQTQPLLSQPRLDDRCEKRRRKNRKTCWKGFYRETTRRTKFTKWFKVDCVTGKQLKGQ